MHRLLEPDRCPNVDYRIDLPACIIRYFAARAIAPGEELCIYYGPDDALWFTPAGAATEEEAEPRVRDEEGVTALGPLTAGGVRTSLPKKVCTNPRGVPAPKRSNYVIFFFPSSRKFSQF